MNRIEKRKIYLDYLESINESKARDKKINKTKEKIHKFLKNKKIINFLVNKVVSQDSSSGTQYLVWFANLVKDFIINSTKNYYKTDDRTITEKSLTILTNSMKRYLEQGELSDEIVNDIFNEWKIEKKWNLDENSVLYDLFDMAEEHPEICFGNEMNDRINSCLEYIESVENITTIVDWLKSPLRENEETILSDYTDYNKVWRVAIDWHRELKASGFIENETGNILMTFDDGFYWIDLQTPYDKDEAEAMGHCGNTTEGTTLYSLRKSKSPHVTMAVNEDDFIITQCKGRNNKKPIEKYHKYIVDLMVWENFVASDIMLEYNTGDDFSADDLNPELYRKLIKDNPNWLDSDFDIDKFLKNFEDDYEVYKKMSVLSIMKFLLEMNNTTFVDEETGDEIDVDRGFNKLLDWVQKNKQITFKSSDAIIELKNNKFHFEKEKGWFLGINFIQAQSYTPDRSYDNSNFMNTIGNLMSNLKLDFKNKDDNYNSAMMINNMSKALTPSTYDEFKGKENIGRKVQELTKKYDEEIHIPKLKEELEKFFKYLSQLGLDDIEIKDNKVLWYVDAKIFFTNINKALSQKYYNKTIDGFDDFISNWRKNIENIIGTSTQNKHYIFEYDIIDDYNKYIVDNLD